MTENTFVKKAQLDANKVCPECKTPYVWNGPLLMCPKQTCERYGKPKT